jgi:glycerate 2-kinase
MLFKNYDTLIKNGQTPTLQQKRKDVLDILTAAVEAVDPYLAVESVIRDHQLSNGEKTIDLSFFDHLFVVGFGKASVRMAQAVCDAISVTKGVIITNDPSGTKLGDSVEVCVGGHPLPNEGSIRGTEKILNLLKTTQANDCVIVLISGGGSALFCKPRIPLSDLQETTELLLRCGASITEINTVRKHLDELKGGQLLRYTNASVISLIMSDIVQDPISAIASGPTAADPSTFTDAENILKKYDLWSTVPHTVTTVITEGIAGTIPETPKENDPLFQSVVNSLVANNERACHGAEKKAKTLGYHATILTTSMTGEANVLGSYLVNKAKQSLSNEKTVFISGGEPVVTMHGHGRGGRNQELILSCLQDVIETDIVVASLATDGIDGNSLAAGAIADGKSLLRAQQKDLESIRYIKENDSNGFFEHLGDAFHTGPTGTNVMDIQIIVL